MSTVLPNMNITIPAVTVTEGPEWAEMLNTALEVVDEHDHSSDKGVKITPAGMDINADLDMNDYNLTAVNKVELVNQDEALTGVDNTCSISFVDGDFYITNSGGDAVQITDGASIVSTVVVPSSPLMPAGAILDYAGSVVPVGFLACDGAAVSRVTYSDLFNAISTAFGVGDGSTTFNLPNFNGRASIGSGAYTDDIAGAITRTIGVPVGTATQTLTIANLAAHSHGGGSHTHSITMNGTNGTAGSVSPYSVSSVTTLTNTDDIQASGTIIATEGGGTAHNNMQPSLPVIKMIKT